MPASTFVSVFDNVLSPANGVVVRTDFITVLPGSAPKTGQLWPRS